MNTIKLDIKKSCVNENYIAYEPTVNLTVTQSIIAKKNEDMGVIEKHAYKACISVMEAFGFEPEDEGKLVYVGPFDDKHDDYMFIIEGVSNIEFEGEQS